MVYAAGLAAEWRRMLMDASKQGAERFASNAASFTAGATAATGAANVTGTPGARA